jgi:arylsulfatase A-like enzyme
MRRARAVVDEVVSSVDVVPTLLEFLDVDPDSQARGRSVLPLVFGGERGPERAAYVEEILTQYGPYDIRAIRAKNEKYIRVLNFEGNEDHVDLHFDLLADPAEQTNLLDTEPERATELRSRLEAMVSEARQNAGTSVETIAVDQATIEALEALGYVDE